MENQPQLHSSIVSMVSLAASIATRHPAMGLCQLQRLREMGIPEHQIQTVIEVARHIRDEAAETWDAAFDAEAGLTETSACCEPAETASGCCEESAPVEEASSGCCGTTPGGHACC